MIKGGLLVISLWVLILSGWTMNIMKLIKCDFKSPYKAEIIHTVGILPPVGMIIGWFHIDDTPDDK